MEKFNFLKKFIICAFCILAAVSITNVVNVSAAKLKYDTVTKDYGKEFKGSVGTISTVCYTERIKFKGETDAIKKINKSLYKVLQKINPEEINSIAKSDASEGRPSDQYEDFLNMSVVYDKGKYVSVAAFFQWYAGGVGNTDLCGYTYNKENGKRVYITKATGLSLKKIKKMLIEQISETGEFADGSFEDVINNMKAADFSYYFIDKDTINVTFAPYELGWGGWFREYELDF